MIKYLNGGKNYPIEKNKFSLSFQCPVGFATYDGETLPPFAGDLGIMAWNGDNRITPRTFDKRRFKNE